MTSFVSETDTLFTVVVFWMFEVNIPVYMAVMGDYQTGYVVSFCLNETGHLCLFTQKKMKFFSGKCSLHWNEGNLHKWSCYIVIVRSMLAIKRFGIKYLMYISK